MKNITFVTALHGDEIVPVLALNEMGVKHVIGNPKAFIERKRFIDADLNSSFGKESRDYESKRANEILQLIKPEQLVIDLHTFTNPSPTFVIIVDLEMLPLAKKVGIPRVVYMKHNIKAGGALINHRRGLSIEVGQNTQEESYFQTKNVVDSLKSKKDRKIDLYEVYGIIEEPGTYKNFEMHSSGFIPILAGKSSYKHFGLKANKIKENI